MKPKDIRSTSALALEEIRKRAVHAVLERGIKQVEVSKILGVSTYSIRKWIQTFQAQGEKGLACKKRGRPITKGTLLPGQLRQTLLTIRDHFPNHVGLPFTLWTRLAIKEYLLKEFNLNLSRWTINRFLKKIGITLQHPLDKSLNYNPQDIQYWVKTRYLTIKKKAEEESAQIYWGSIDSCKFNIFEINKEYLLRGKNKELSKVPKYQVLYSLADNKAPYFMVLKKKLTTSIVLHFLYRLIQGKNKKIFLILNDNKIYHAKKIKDFLKREKNKIDIFFLPKKSSSSLKEKPRASWKAIQIQNKSESIILNDSPLPNHIAKLIKNIYKPLEEVIGISSFNYIGVKNSTDWIQCMPLICRNKIECTIKNLSMKDYGYFVWPVNVKNNILYPLYEKIYYEVDIYHQLNDIIEIFCFGWEKEPASYFHKTNYNLDILKYFALYFKENLVKILATDPISKSFILDLNEDIEREIIHYPNVFKKLDTLLSERRVSQCEFNVNDRKVNFTRRELSCLYFFAQGKSSKEIANILQISPRTVESYINGIKIKTGISYKSELISFFLKTLSDENLENPLFLKL